MSTVAVSFPETSSHVMVIETDKTSATWTDLAATAETQHQVERGLLLNVVVSQGAAVFELLTREDQTLLIRRNSYRNKTNERASSSSVTHSRFLFVSHPSPRVNLTNTPWAPRLARARRGGIGAWIFALSEKTRRRASEAGCPGGGGEVNAR